MVRDFETLVNEFSIELRHCRQIYSRSAATIAFQNNHLIDKTSSQFLQLMQDLYTGLMLKLFFSTAHVDGDMNRYEERLANVLFYQLFSKQLKGHKLRQALEELIPYTDSLDWRSLVEPFAKYKPLENEVANLETSIVRIGNMVAKADGTASQIELDTLAGIQSILMQRLYVGQDRIPLQSDPEGYDQKAQQQIRQRPGAGSSSTETDLPDATIQLPEESLEQALDELNELVGLEEVKAEVNQLINFIKVQKMREEQGLPKNKLSLHMVFGGNPGTGKTTVARLLGRIYGAMGVLKKGHLVETDRSGLVAEYSGQTGPKANKVIDTALDGVLFVDEAYSLIAEKGEDPFGHEAVQALLKRMEDDRERLIVILAGYPNEMTRLLESNPGLSSRFSHRIDFEDYTPEELARIWLLISRKNQYKMDAKSTAKLLVGLQWLYQRRDKHFGNGRLVRNTFEKAIRYLADRIVKVPDVTREMLTEFQAEDIRFPDVPEEVLSDDALTSMRFEIRCPECDKESRIGMEHFCRKFKCKSCQAVFRIESASPMVAT